MTAFSKGLLVVVGVIVLPITMFLCLVCVLFWIIEFMEKCFGFVRAKRKWLIYLGNLLCLQEAEDHADFGNSSDRSNDESSMPSMHKVQTVDLN